MSEISFVVRVRNYMQQGLASATQSLKGFTKSAGLLLGGFLGFKSFQKLFGSVGDLVERVKELKELGGTTTLISDDALSQIDEANNRLAKTRDTITAGVTKGLAAAVNHLRQLGAGLGALSAGGDSFAQAMNDAAQSLANEDATDTLDKQIARLKAEKTAAEEATKALEDHRKAEIAGGQAAGERAEKLRPLALSMSARREERDRIRQQEREERKIEQAAVRAEKKLSENKRFGRDRRSLTESEKFALEYTRAKQEQDRTTLEDSSMETAKNTREMAAKIKELLQMK